MAKKAARRKAGARKGGRKTARRTSGRTGGRKTTARRKTTGRTKTGPAARRARKAGAARRAAARKAAARGRGARRKAAARSTARKTTARKASARRAPARKKPQAKPARRRPSAPALERPRRIAPAEAGVPTPPSSLDFEREASMARTGRAELREALREHTETGPAMTGGDVDGDWENAYSSGESAPGGDMPTPDQDRVDDIGRAIGVQYQDTEELKSADKVDKRDRQRWELDPASSEDYVDRTREK
jgi:hypothetical protein